VQYVALRNILLIIQRRPAILANDVRVFFCKYNDPIYVKMAKLEIMYRLTREDNVQEVLAELKEWVAVRSGSEEVPADEKIWWPQRYANEVDVDFVRKAVRSIGRLAIKIQTAADLCIPVLISLMRTKISYVVQEAIVVIKDIFRRYPNQYESVIAILCENLDSLDEPEAKASMIWIIGQYADRIENSDELLDDFLYTFSEEPAEVQLALLTAIVKLFIKRPTVGQELVPKVLKMATEEVDNPDLRDRVRIEKFVSITRWSLSRFLASVGLHVLASAIFGPSIDTRYRLGGQAAHLDRDWSHGQGYAGSSKPSPNPSGEFFRLTPRLRQLLLHTGTLSSIYHKSPQTFIRTAKARYLTGKTAPLPARAQAVIESFYFRHHRLSRFERFITETPSTTWDSLAIGSPAPIINITTRSTCHCTSTTDSVDRH
jgi:AP-2 complex subunit beta-1